MEKFLLYSHAGSGGLVLLLGLINMLNRKGGKYHRILGYIYVVAMWWICLSALTIISFYRFSFFLMVIAVLTFYSTFIGIRVLKRKKIGSEKWYDWAVSLVTILFGLGLFSYGVYVFYITKSLHPLGFLSLIFGSGTFYFGYSDIRFFKSANLPEKNWWLFQHIKAMGGSYISAITAFGVQNNDIFLPENYAWVAWLLPSILISPMISYTVRKYKNRAMF